MNFRPIVLATMTLTLAAASAPAFAQPYDPGCVRSNQNNQAAGAIAGAIGGALIGNALAGRHDKGAGTAAGAVGGAIVGGAVAGANNHPCPAGYYYAPSPGRQGPPPPPPGDRRDFWYGAPAGVHERIDFMQTRISREIDRGVLSRREARDANRELTRIRGEDRRLSYQDGGRLRPADRDYLQGLLDNLSQRLHWDQRYG